MSYLMTQENDIEGDLEVDGVMGWLPLYDWQNKNNSTSDGQQAWSSKW